MRVNYWGARSHNGSESETFPCYRVIGQTRALLFKNAILTNHARAGEWFRTIIGKPCPSFLWQLNDRSARVPSSKFSRKLQALNIASKIGWCADLQI